MANIRSAWSKVTHETAFVWSFQRAFRTNRYKLRTGRYWLVCGALNLSLDSHFLTNHIINDHFSANCSYCDTLRIWTELNWSRCGIQFDWTEVKWGQMRSFYLYQELRLSWNHKYVPHLKYLRLKRYIFIFGVVAGSDRNRPEVDFWAEPTVQAKYNPFELKSHDVTIPSCSNSIISSPLSLSNKCKPRST